MTTLRKILLGASGALLIIGICLLATVSWQAATGVFLIIWAHKLECHTSF